VQTRGTMNLSERNGFWLNKGFMKWAMKRVAYAKHTTNKNPFFTLSSSILKGWGSCPSCSWVRVDIHAGVNLACLLLICIVIHGGIAIKVCISNCKIDFCQWGLLQHEKCMTSNDQLLPKENQRLPLW
jgi:hypothetical protein